MNWEASLPRNLHLHQQLKCGTKKQHHPFSFTQLWARDGAIRNGNAGWFSFPSQHNTTALWARDPAWSKSIGAQGQGLRACTGLRRSAAGVWRLSLPLRVKKYTAGKTKAASTISARERMWKFLLVTDKGLEIRFPVLQYLEDSNSLSISSALVLTRTKSWTLPKSCRHWDCCWGFRLENFVMKILLVKYGPRISYETTHKSHPMFPKVSWPLLRA